MFDSDYRKKSGEIIKFIKRVVGIADFSKVLVAISGGVDSSVVLNLCLRALGRDNVLVALLPYGRLNSQGLKDAYLIVKNLNIEQKNIFEIDIKKTVNILCSYDKVADRTRKGNIMARVRMIYLYDLAKKNRALVVGTENKTEYLLGYFTRFGDEASDIEPIRSLYKTQVISLARFLKIPESIIAKAPTAGLWTGQTDEGEFGFTYREADKILYLKLEKKLFEDEIAREGIDKKIVKKVLSRVAQNEFKHKVPIIY